MLAAITSLLLTALVRRFALRLKFVDQPGGHKGHQQPVALGGGLAVTLTVIVPILAAALLARWWAAAPPSWMPEHLALHLAGVVAQTPVALAMVFCAATLCLMGLIDQPTNGVQICISIHGIDIPRNTSSVGVITG